MNQKKESNDPSSQAAAAYFHINFIWFINTIYQTIILNRNIA
ncbi:MAG: hypothetical protein ABI550_04560 [Ignavibacteriaceae bacterium]